MQVRILVLWSCDIVFQIQSSKQEQSPYVCLKCNLVDIQNLEIRSQILKSPSVVFRIRGFFGMQRVSEGTAAVFEGQARCDGAIHRVPNN